MFGENESQDKLWRVIFAGFKELKEIQLKKRITLSRSECTDIMYNYVQNKMQLKEANNERNKGI